MVTVSRKKFLMDDWARDTRVMAEFLADMGERVVPSKEGGDPENSVEWVFFPLDKQGPTPDKEEAIKRNIIYLEELVKVEGTPRIGPNEKLTTNDVVELKRLSKAGYRFIAYFDNGEKWAFRNCPSKMCGEWFFDKTVSCESVDPECFMFLGKDYDLVDIRRWGW